MKSVRYLAGSIRTFISQKRNYILTWIAVWAIFLSYIASAFCGDNLIYAIGEINAYDSSLFASNVFLGQGIISPRFFLDTVFSAIMHLNGGDWAAVAMGTVYFGTAIISFAIVNIIFNICNKNHILYATVLAMLFAVNGNELAGFSLSAFDSISIGVALSFAVLSISFVVGENKKFNMAWIFMTLSALCHVHEGLYGFVIVFIFFIVDVIQKKKFSLRDNWGLLLYICTVFAVVAPSLYTDSMSLTNAEFVRIYAEIRHPHHLVPSAWGKSNIIRSLFIIISFAIFRIEYLYVYNREKVKRFLLEVGLFISAWSGAVIIAYVFTEIYPLAFVPTMFISKFFKYVVLISLIWLIQTANDYFNKHEVIVGFALLCYAFTTHKLVNEHLVIWFLCIFVIAYFQRSKKNSIIYPISLGGVFFAFAFTGTFDEMGRGLKIILLVILLLWLILKLAQKYSHSIYKLSIVSIALVLLAGSLYGNLYWVSDGKIVLQTSKNLMVSTMGADLYQLAESFEQKTEKKETFLADPDDMVGSGWFQVAAERNCYVIFKVVPSSKNNMQQWYERYLETTKLFDKEPTEVANIMKEAHIKYLLVNNSNFLKFDLSNTFKLFTSCDGDSYRVYQLLE